MIGGKGSRMRSLQSDPRENGQQCISLTSHEGAAWHTQYNKKPLMMESSCSQRMASKHR